MCTLSRKQLIIFKRWSWYKEEAPLLCTCFRNVSSDTGNTLRLRTYTEIYAKASCQSKTRSWRSYLKHCFLRPTTQQTCFNKTASFQNKCRRNARTVCPRAGSSYAKSWKLFIAAWRIILVRIIWNRGLEISWNGDTNRAPIRSGQFFHTMAYSSLNADLFTQKQFNYFLIIVYLD